MEHFLHAKPSSPNYTVSFTILIVHKTPFLASVLGKAFFIGFKKAEKRQKSEDT